MESQRIAKMAVGSIVTLGAIFPSEYSDKHF